MNYPNSLITNYFGKNSDIRGILFDLDGVLVDMCDAHKWSLNKALLYYENFEISDEQHKLNYDGLPTKTKLQKLLKLGLISGDNLDKIFDLKQSFTLTYIDTITPDPIRIQMLQKLQNDNIVCGCVTNSIRSTAVKMLKNSGLYDYLSFIITNEDSPNPKPYPDPYLMGINRLKMKVGEVIAVEDNINGIKSAESAGLKVFVVQDYETLNYENIRKFIDGK